MIRSFLDSIQSIMDNAAAIMALSSKHKQPISTIEHVMKLHANLMAVGMTDEEIIAVQKLFAQGRLNIKKLMEDQS